MADQDGRRAGLQMGGGAGDVGGDRLQAVVGHCGRLARAAIPAHIDRAGSEAGLGNGAELVAPAVPAFREAMHQQHQRAAALHRGAQPDAVGRDLGEAHGGHVSPSSDGYIGRSPVGMAGRLGSGPALGPPARSLRELQPRSVPALRHSSSRRMNTIGPRQNWRVAQRCVRRACPRCCSSRACTRSRKTAGARQLDDGLHPVGLGLRRWLQRAHAALAFTAPRMWPMWRDCSSSMCWKLALWPDCWVVITNRFGKPRVNRPWKVLAPPFHLSVSVRPPRPRHLEAQAAGEIGAHLEAGAEDQAIQRVLLARPPPRRAR